jgi:hypothetical protein
MQELSEDLELWRYTYLTVYVKLPHGDASELAATDIDLHEIERLVNAGCPLPVARKILEPV